MFLNNFHILFCFGNIKNHQCDNIPWISNVFVNSQLITNYYCVQWVRVTFAEFKMYCETSRQNCFCFIISIFGTHFADTFPPRSYPHSKSIQVLRWSYMITMALHDKSSHLINVLVIFDCWKPTRMWVALINM